MRTPTGELLAKAAFLTCARLDLKSWLAQLARPLETMRWEWKRFRLAFFYIAATIVHHARQVVVRLARTHRFHELVVCMTKAYGHSSASRWRIGRRRLRSKRTPATRRPGSPS